MEIEKCCGTCFWGVQVNEGDCECDLHGSYNWICNVCPDYEVDSDLIEERGLDCDSVNY